MSTILILGAGMMGSAMAWPATDNGNAVRLVGTHLDNDIIDSIKATGWHPTLKFQMPQGVTAYRYEELGQALDGDIAFVIGGVSSFGVEWFAKTALPRIPDTLPILSITKGMQDLEDGTLVCFPHYIKMLNPSLKHNLNAVGGPCTSYELSSRNQTCVDFCGDDMATLEMFKRTLQTSYYHITPSTDVIGVEAAVAMKNAYALAITMCIGLDEAARGVGCVESNNPQAAVFGQATREMTRILKVTGGGVDLLPLGAGDLYVTVYGGRTRKLGILLGRGMSYADAREQLKGITLESVEITTRAARGIRRMAELGKVNLQDFPLLIFIDNVLHHGAKPNIPWDDFR
ncbi:MAG: hypothetical protein IJJ26_01220 [Victivallales bacterium]|nr:hypothetical protein [Victivallales bacterium]